MNIGFYPNDSASEFLTRQKEIIESLGHNIIGIDCKQKKIDFLKPEVPKIIFFNWLENGGNEGKFKALFFYISWIINFCRLKNKKIKTVVFFHNKQPHSIRKIKKPFSLLFMFLIFRLSDAVAVLCEDSKKYLGILVSRKKRNKVFVIPHINFVKNSEDVVEQKSRERMKIGFVGMIRPYKNIELILRLASELESLPIDFIIRGQASQKEYCARMEADAGNMNNVYFMPGYIPECNIGEVVRSFDVLLLPYNTESAMNSGVAILAFSNKRCVISPKISTLMDYPEELNYLYDYNTNEDIYSQLKKATLLAYEDWLRNRDTFLEKGNRLYNLVCEKNSETKVAQAYKDIIDYLGN